MNIVLRRWMVSALGFLLLATLYACLVPDVGYVGASTSRPGPTTAAGGRVITWHRLATANVARSRRHPAPIGRRRGPARLRQFRRGRVGIEINPI